MLVFARFLTAPLFFILVISRLNQFLKAAREKVYKTILEKRDQVRKIKNLDRLKSQNNVIGRTIHVADKRLNYAKNIAISTVLLL